MRRHRRVTSTLCKDLRGYTAWAHARCTTRPGRQRLRRRRIGLLHRQRTLIGALHPTFRHLTSTLRRPTGARITVAAVVVALALLAAQQGLSQAAPPFRPAPPVSILATTLGVGIPSTHPVTLGFAAPMDRASVADGIVIAPRATVTLHWSGDGRSLSIAPASRWQTGRRYLIALPPSTRLANGATLQAPLRFAFTTQTAPTITDFEVSEVATTTAEQRPSVLEPASRPAPRSPTDTASGTTVRTSIRIGFSAAMDRADVERSFLITPFLAGSLTWDAGFLIFTPANRLQSGARYAVSLTGARDLEGNALAGDATFSFTTAAAAQVVRVQPTAGAKGITVKVVQVWFSAAMDTAAAARAFQLVDLTVGRAVRGSLTWNQRSTQLSFAPAAALPSGHSFEIRLRAGTVDADGNAVASVFGFTTRAAVRALSYGIVPVGSSSAQAYALAKINASRAQYGLAPLRLDPAISAVAAAHAWDQIRYGYFSHTGRDGSDVKARLRAAGITFSWAGENQCETGRPSITSSIDWCHSIMMAEPYPGYPNHIGNILSTHFTRVGFGYATGGGRTVLTWDFAN